MGGCAGCVGPNRRAEKYKVNRLTEDSPIKNSVTPSELPLRRYTEKVIEELNESKKRIDHNNNLINPLLSSLGILNEAGGQKGRMSSSALYTREQPTKTQNYLTSSALGYGLRQAESKYQNQNAFKQQKRSIFEKPFVESRVMKDGRGVHTSEFKTSSSPPPLRDSYNYKETTSAIYELGNLSKDSNEPYSFNYKDSSADMFKILAPLQTRNSSKEPLKEVFNNNATPVTSSRSLAVDRSKHYKSNRLLNIPELPQEDARTPQYVNQIRRQNGEDVKKTGLEFVPRSIESVPRVNLHKYLKDLQ